MSKKVFLTTILIFVCAGVTYMYFVNSPLPTVRTIEQQSIGNLHSDILKIIASNNDKPVMGISPSDAVNELKTRETKMSIADLSPANVRSLSFDVLVYISKSPTTVAGIQPKQAVNEIIRRYLVVDDENLTFKSMLLALKHSDSQEAIDKWAANEDTEEMEKFIKEASEKDDMVAFAYGIKHRNTDKEGAREKIKNFAKHVNDINDPHDVENYDELLREIDSLD